MFKKNNKSLEDEILSNNNDVFEEKDWFSRLIASKTARRITLGIILGATWLYWFGIDIIKELIK